MHCFISSLIFQFLPSPPPATVLVLFISAGYHPYFFRVLVCSEKGSRRGTARSRKRALPLHLGYAALIAPRLVKRPRTRTWPCLLIWPSLPVPPAFRHGDRSRPEAWGLARRRRLGRSNAADKSAAVRVRGHEDAHRARVRPPVGMPSTARRIGPTARLRFPSPVVSRYPSDLITKKIQLYKYVTKYLFKPINININSASYAPGI